MRRHQSELLRPILEAVNALAMAGRASTERDIPTFEDERRRVLSQLLDREARVRGMGSVPFSLGPAVGQSPRGEKSRREIVAAFATRVEAIAQGRPLPIDTLAVAFESMYELAQPALSTDAAVVSLRRDRGVFFTPPDVAEFLASITLAPLVGEHDRRSKPRVVDPALGAGTFLLAALRNLRESRCERERDLSPVEAGRAVATEQLYGVDLDPSAVGVAKCLLWLEVGDPTWDGAALDTNVVRGDSIAEAMKTWSAWFPAALDGGGFDAVLTNPPWGTIKPLRSEMTARLVRRSEANSETAEPPNPGLESAWSAHVATARDYRSRINATGDYSHQGAKPGGIRRGDAELYKYFAERTFQLLAPKGRAGLVLPAAFHRAEGAGALRSLYLENGTFDYFFEFQNRRRVFPIHGMFRFLLLAYQRGPADGIKQLAFGLTEVAQARRAVGEKDVVTLSAKALRSIGGRVAAVPEVASRAAADLLVKLSETHPALTSGESPWNVSFRRELDMTNDAPAFVHVEAARHDGWRQLGGGTWEDVDGRRYAPVYEGRMVHQFDHAAKAYRTGRARRADWVALAPKAKEIRPQWVIEEQEALRRGAVLAFRAGFCDVTGHANERTVLAALIPPNSTCGNKVPTCRFASADERLHLLWLAVANSFVVDWIVRRWVSTTLNFFYWEQVPFVRPDPDGPVGTELITAAGSLSGVAVEGRHLRWTKPVTSLLERAALRARIDALVARSYGLTEKDLALILADFPLLDRRQGLEAPKPTATRDVVLQAFAGAADEVPDASSERRERGIVVRGMPYVPSEAAPIWLGSDS